MRKFFASLLVMMVGCEAEPEATQAEKPPVAEPKLEWSEEPPAFIKQWKALHFPEADEPAWKAWVEHAERGEESLVALLSKDVRDAHKRRALFVLLTPRLIWTPFFYPEYEWRRTETHLGSDKIRVKGLSPEMRTFMLGIIVTFGDYLDSMVSGRNYAKRPDESRLRYTYNGYLRELLSVLPPEEDERAFKAYEINDFYAGYGRGWTSGYTCLRDLWKDPDVPEVWKLRADQMMREQVLGELDGTRQARESWENALRQYTQSVLEASGNHTFSEKRSHDQLAFITSRTSRNGHKTMSFSDFDMFWRGLDNDRNRDMRRQLAEFMVKRNGKPFNLCDDWLCNMPLYRPDWARTALPKRITIAREMLDLLKDDPEAVTSLEIAIRDAEAELGPRNAEERRAKAGEDALLANMR